MNLTNKTESVVNAKCLGCAVPSCVRGCPVGTNIPLVVRLVQSGNFAKATKVVNHPFGGVCGSICPHDRQCRGSCVLAKKGQAVQIGNAECEAFLRSPYVVTKQSDKLRGLNFAVVGGGVCGITFAVKCVEHGARVTLYEQNRLLDTLYSVPDFRLERKFLDDIVSAVRLGNIQFVKQRVDRDGLVRLSDEFDAVLLAVGAKRQLVPDIDGANFATSANDFLLCDKPCSAVIVGGGNTAMDCARLNVRQGGKSVVAYRRTVADMPAFSAEINSAIADGVVFACNLSPKSISQNTDGTLSVTLAQTLSDGRGKLTVLPQTQTFVCDKLVFATGNSCDEMFCDVGKYVVTDENRLVKGFDNVYCGGDAVGNTLVAQAVCDANFVFDVVTERFGVNL